MHRLLSSHDRQTLSALGGNFRNQIVRLEVGDFHVENLAEVQLGATHVNHRIDIRRLRSASRDETIALPRDR